jgi:hypothetical protein
MIELVDKEKLLKNTIENLQEMFGAEAFDIVDHWQGDLRAVGIARREDHDVLVYVSTDKQMGGRYFVSLELPSFDAEMPYDSAGDFKDVDFDELARIVKQHLSLR